MSVIFTQHVQSVCIYYTTMCVIIFTYRSDERTLYLNMCVRSLIYLCRRRGSTHTPYVADAASTRALRFCPPPGGQNRFFSYSTASRTLIVIASSCASVHPGLYTRNKNERKPNGDLLLCYVFIFSRPVLTTRWCCVRCAAAAERNIFTYLLCTTV